MKKWEEMTSHGLNHLLDEIKKLDPVEDITLEKLRTGAIRTYAKKIGIDSDKYRTRKELLNALPDNALNHLRDMAKNTKGSITGARYYSLSLKQTHQNNKKS
ncbi:MAG: hypothetical protein NTV89_18145 [Proteobacteria bacterium]|nr:hypothetical protein [Pseudomonadota bacterium]